MVSSPETSTVPFRHMTTSRTPMGMDRIHCTKSARSVWTPLMELVEQHQYLCVTWRTFFLSHSPLQILLNANSSLMQQWNRRQSSTKKCVTLISNLFNPPYWEIRWKCEAYYEILTVHLCHFSSRLKSSALCCLASVSGYSLGISSWLWNIWLSVLSFTETSSWTRPTHHISDVSLIAQVEKKNQTCWPLCRC